MFYIDQKPKCDTHNWYPTSPVYHKIIFLITLKNSTSQWNKQLWGVPLLWAFYQDSGGFMHFAKFTVENQNTKASEVPKLDLSLKYVGQKLCQIGEYVVALNSSAAF